MQRAQQGHVATTILTATTNEGGSTRLHAGAPSPALATMLQLLWGNTRDSDETGRMNERMRRRSGRLVGLLVCPDCRR